MNNTQKIIDALKSHGPLDDDQLAVDSGVFPRQQVNQICRRLQVKGTLLRMTVPGGKIVNVLKERREFEPLSTVLEARKEASAAPSRSHSAQNCEWNLEDSDAEKTLFVICCSKSKVSGSVSPRGPSILDYLPGSLARRLRDARQEVAPRADLDESTLLPAWRRYGGYFYQAANQTLARSVGESLSLIIISGGYGLLLAEERIGLYDLRFRRSDWPEGLLDAVP